MSFWQKLKLNIVPAGEAQKKAEGKKPRAKSQGKETRDERDRWFESEGKLNVDLYKAGENLVVQSTIAGIKPEDLEITIQGDVINIKGVRIKPEEIPGEEKSYFHQECYWGPFSRQIILPEEVDPSRSEASLKGGILTIKVPCLERDKKRKIAIQG